MSLNESIVEDAALEWFGELGYAVGHGPHIAPGEPAAERDSFGEVVLVGRLRVAIRRLNPAIPEEAREEALRKVLRVGTPSLTQTNRAAHRMLRDGVPVEYIQEEPSPQPSPKGRGSDGHYRGGFDFAGLKKKARELRAKQTEAEGLLWELLRDRQLGDAKFRRNHQFGDYICDFYCHEAKLVIECDGEVHNNPESQAHDRKRDAYMKSQRPPPWETSRRNHAARMAASSSGQTTSHPYAASLQPAIDLSPFSPGRYWARMREALGL